ncbi:MAG: membrane protein insertase YidC [Acidimicrobiales bacterium]|jgi:YidC/Oxa1 family membrane protein insertase
MILGSIITSIIGPFANAFGYVLAAFYSFTHSYGDSIILLTLAVMIVVFPLTRTGTRSMMRMQLLQPQLLTIRKKYKVQPGMSAEERQAIRLKLNEEMMALYRENGVNPTGGCLPMFMQFPIFIVLYNVIRGMTREVTVGTGKHAKAILQPQYIPKRTQLYHAVITSHGNLGWIGLNLTDSVRTHGLSLVGKSPYVAVILVAVVLQYVSIWQITNRNPSAAQANPQMQAIQKFMPLIFVFIYILLPAGVGLYFIVSSLFRIGQQEYMYKHDPKIVAIAHDVREMHKKNPIETTSKPGRGMGRAAAGGRPELGRPSSSQGGPPRKGFADRLRDAAAGFQGNLPDASNGKTSEESAAAGQAPAPNPSAGSKPPTAAGNGIRSSGQSRNGSSRSGANGTQPDKSTSSRAAQNRSRNKRPRRP